MTQTSQDLPTAGRMQDRMHYLPIRVYYEDTDFSGIVYHANYLRYCERARTDILRLFGINQGVLAKAEDPTAYAVARMELEFKSPARMDDALVVHSFIDTLKGARIIFDQSIFRENQLLFRALVTVVAMTPGGRPKRLDADMVNKWQELMKDDKPDDNNS